MEAVRVNARLVRQAFLCVLLPASLFAQVGELKIDVKDPSGAAVSAKGMAVSLESGVRRAFETDAQGSSMLSGLPYGRYKVQISKEGFSAASVVIDLPEVTDIDTLVASIARLAREQNVLRAKGYLAVKGKPMRLLVQSVGERVRHQFDKPWGSAPRQSKLVVIGEQGDIDESAIKAGLGV